MTSDKTVRPNPSPLAMTDRVPLRAAALAAGSIIRFDTFTWDSTILPEKREQPDGGKFELYDAMRFLEVRFTRPAGHAKGGGTQIRLVPWAHVAHVTPMDDGK